MLRSPLALVTRGARSIVSRSRCQSKVLSRGFADYKKVAGARDRNQQGKKDVPNLAALAANDDDDDDLDAGDSLQGHVEYDWEEGDEGEGDGGDAELEETEEEFEQQLNDFRDVLFLQRVATAPVPEQDKSKKDVVVAPVVDSDLELLVPLDNPPKLTAEHYGKLRATLAPRRATVSKQFIREMENPRLKLQNEVPDVDNPIFWDEETWNMYIKTGDEILPLDPYYGYNPIEGAEASPKQFAKLDQFPSWGRPRKSKPGAECRFCRPDKSAMQENQMVCTNVELLTKFINERGMITTRKENKNCSRHQRKLARVIKQARHLALLSPISNWKARPEYLIEEPDEADGMAMPFKHRMMQFITPPDGDEIRGLLREKLGNWEGTKGWDDEEDAPTFSYDDPADHPDTQRMGRGAPSSELVEEAKKREEKGPKRAARRSRKDHDERPPHPSYRKSPLPAYHEDHPDKTFKFE